MSSVILRCPNCGTAQSALGECEACHEARVRYYCTNHDPGQWLDAPACPQCGAKFGQAAPARRAPPSAPDPLPRPPRPASARPPAGASRGPERIPVREAPPPVRGGLDGIAPRDRDALLRRWPDLLRRARIHPAPRTREPESRPAAVFPGLFRRLVLTFLFLVFLLFAMSLFAGGPFLQILLNILLSS